MERRDLDALARGELLDRVATERLVLGLRRGVLDSRLADARDACLESAALRSQARQIAGHAAAALRRRDAPPARAGGGRRGARPRGGDGDPARLREHELALLARVRRRHGHAELDVRLAGVVAAVRLQAALAAGLDLVQREHRGLVLAVAGDGVAMALQPRLGGLARALLGQRGRALAVGQLLGGDPQRGAVRAAVGDLQHRGRAVHADQLGAERGGRVRVRPALRVRHRRHDRGERERRRRQRVLELHAGHPFLSPPRGGLWSIRQPVNRNERGRAIRSEDDLEVILRDEPRHG
jgi:hypothetical protein